MSEEDRLLIYSLIERFLSHKRSKLADLPQQIRLKMENKITVAEGVVSMFMN